MSMINKDSNKLENQLENLTEFFKSTLSLWLHQKETGKLIIEINTNQGGITKVWKRTEATLQ